MNLQGKGVHKGMEHTSADEVPQAALELSLLFTLRCQARRDAMGRCQHEALTSLMDCSQQQLSTMRGAMVSPHGPCVADLSGCTFCLMWCSHAMQCTGDA